MATPAPPPTTRFSASSPAADLTSNDDDVFRVSLAPQREFTPATTPTTPAAAPSVSVVADGAGSTTALTAFDLEKASIFLQTLSAAELRTVLRGLHIKGRMPANMAPSRCRPWKTSGSAMRSSSP